MHIPGALAETPELQQLEPCSPASHVENDVWLWSQNYLDTEILSQLTDQAAFEQMWLDQLGRSITFYAEQRLQVYEQLAQLIGPDISMDHSAGYCSEQLSLNPHDCQEVYQTLERLLSYASSHSQGFVQALKGHASGTSRPERLLPRLWAAPFFTDTALSNWYSVVAHTVTGSASKATTPEPEQRRLSVTTFRTFATEVEFLHSAVAAISDDILPKIVAHRGFHDVEDSTSRPIENSLPAFDLPWSAGLHLCECDITLTSDGHIVLAHDDSLHRVALQPTDKRALEGVKGSKMIDIVSTSLKSGVRSPLLTEVLRSAHLMPESAKLVIELKDGGLPLVKALMQLFEEKPWLTHRIAMIMSFDRTMTEQASASYATMMRAQSRKTGRLGVRQIASMDTIHMQSRAKPNLNPGIQFLLLGETGSSSEACGCDGGPLYHRMDVTKPEEIDAFVRNERAVLDGVYLEYEPEFMPGGQKHDAFRALCARYQVGVWGVPPEKDHVDLVAAFVEFGARYVNTDLPLEFVSETP